MLLFAKAIYILLMYSSSSRFIFEYSIYFKWHNNIYFFFSKWRVSEHPCCFHYLCVSKKNETRYPLIFGATVSKCGHCGPMQRNTRESILGSQFWTKKKTFSWFVSQLNLHKASGFITCSRLSAWVFTSEQAVAIAHGIDNEKQSRFIWYFGSDFKTGKNWRFSFIFKLVSCCELVSEIKKSEEKQLKINFCLDAIISWIALFSNIRF